MGKSKTIIKRILNGLLIIIIIASGAFYIYTLDYYHALPIAMEVLSDNNTNLNLEKNMIVFTPPINKNGKGLIFYPGGKVEYLSYLPLMQRIASQGYTVFLLKMPLNLAVFNQNAANTPIEQYSDINTWYLSGHSLGGAMASIYASKNIDKVNGLILLGSYPAADLSEFNLKMVSIYGSEDNILNKDTFEKNKIFAPKQTDYIKIKGGNHAYYGSYGEQKKDGLALITPEEQQKLTADRIIEFMDK